MNIVTLNVVKEEGAHNPSTCQQDFHTSYSQVNIKVGSCRKMLNSGGTLQEG